jgi:AcrR family transcriptional regulator
VRKTNVEELARSAGIAKGTFYSFFESKEDLCLEIYNEEEAAMAGRIAEVLSAHDDPTEALEALMRFSLEFVRGDSLLIRLRESGEYQLLARGVGKVRLAQHLSHDVVVAGGLLEALRAKGATPDVSPEILAAVLRAVVLLMLHEREIGADVFGPALESMVRWIAVGITKGGKKHEESSGA